MNPWTQVLNQIWYYLEQGPKSAAITAAFPAANRYHYGSNEPEALPPTNNAQPVMIVDQTGGQIELDYSPMYLRATEEFQITVWSDTLALAGINDLRLKVLSAIEAGLPDLGLDTVLDVKMRSGRVTLSPDKIERDADGRLMPWRKDLQRTRKRAILLELSVTFLIDRGDLG
ncbi:MAG: hypothetical protein WC975_07295 [Phycisphaerae bacterium]